MAATRARSTLSSPDLGSFRTRGRARGATRNTPTVAAGLGLALAAALAYAVFASGAIGVPEETRLQIGVAVIALATLAVLAFGGGLRVTPAPLAGGGLALLAGFAVWSGLSAAWSVSPDESWLELNRAITYTLVASLGVVLGSSLPRAAERVALGYLALAALAAAYALGGKLFPWLEIPGLIDLDHTADFSRLRAPLEYWNALGLACVLAIPIAVRAAADLASSARLRTFALVSLVILLITLMLTYSRGGLLVLMIGLVLLVAMSTDRLRLAAVLGAGVLGALPGFLVGVMRDDLTRDGLSASARTDDGLILALAVAVGVAITVVLGVRIARAGERLVLSPKADRRARRAGLVLVAALALLALGALAVSERGVTGTVSNTFQEFTEPKFDKQNDPARVLKTNSGNRWIWWEEAAGAFSDRPLVGFGAGSFPLVHRLYRDNTIEVRQPHNVPLEFLSETGLIGAGLGLGGLALLGVVATRTARRGGDPRERAYAATMVVGAAAWGLHTLVDWDWDIPGVTLPVLLFLGVLAARPPSLGPTHRVGGGRRPVRFVLGAAALVAVMALAALPALSEKLTDDALTQAATNTKADLDEAGRKAALAKRLNPFAVEPVFAQAAIAERGNQAAAAGDLLVDAVERQPDNPSTWIRLARFQVLLNDPGAAVKSLVQA
ncbi:MAG: O-antigen ligase family protein, partial [Thermoleophilaceae bacterium]|nr:O-antigen ligase family protein [Thermoleophilaceae bacterium]